MTIGQRIAQKRKELGLSQEALGNQLGLSRQSIYKWESGSALPEIEKLIALSALFGVSVGWLLGVEEDAASKDASPSGELTEQQLRMVEQIADRYLAAQPKAKKPRRWPFVLAGAVLLFGLVNLLAQLDALRMQQESIQSNLSRVENSVDRQIGSITGKVEELLKAQNDLTADYGTEVASTNLFSNSITFSLYAVPKNYTEGMRAEFYADDGSGRKVPAAGVYQPELGERFFADLKCGLTDSITLSVVFTASDGTRQTQLLDTYEGLYSATMPDGTVDDNLMWKELEAPGVLTLTEDERYVWVASTILPLSALPPRRCKASGWAFF